MGKEDSIQEIIESLSRLHRPVDGAAWRKLGLSHSQMGMLYMLCFHRDLSPKQVARHLGITQSAVSQLFDPLIDKGLVQRQADPKDRRITRLRLTTKGSGILKKMRKLKTAGMRAGLESLSSKEIEQLEKIVSKISKAVK